MTMATSKTYRWRKTTDIHREYALFELVDGDIALLDAGFTMKGFSKLLLIRVSVENNGVGSASQTS